MARVRQSDGTSARRGPTAPAALLAVLLTATGCASNSGTPDSASTPSSQPAPENGPSKRIGALFVGDLSGQRACTASIVDSPHRNLLVTAAHCVYTSELGRLDNLVFAPGYRNGQAPYGTWPLASITIDPHWTTDEDPEYDVAFLTVAPVNGKEIEDAFGGNPIGTDQGFDLPVSITGYPNDHEDPITCSGRTRKFSATQERFDCYGYTNGTSGSPWLTTAGKVIGVIGGYQQGGDTDQTSYSITFDSRVAELYRKATA
ncbi:trypsin-like peptidase domain-containing protein [Kitasatospora sp. GP82]|uniref:trypsin-like serine peptidase n=1 Tax=Kitasatospora sp. GP82 TaxID=3035089 RepID=UPI002473FC68|nr:trypsin-like peptidase domain-containing protein [Kitasatospora sp. GP82]MDH6125283.1 V8-like Glu-specific endopeptidase [Kitasatospora sp. GP82]